MSKLLDTIRGIAEKLNCDPPNSFTEDQYSNLRYCSTGNFKIDLILARHSKTGGLVRSKLIELSGNEGSGKTSLCWAMCAEAQKRKKGKGVAFFIDLENKASLEQARNFGVITDPERLIFLQPNGLESANYTAKAAIAAVKSSETEILVIDSIVAILTKREILGEVDAANVGVRAAFQSKLLNKILNAMRDNGPPVILVNQIRDNIGGQGSTTPGARAIKFRAIQRLSVYKSDLKKVGAIPIGQKCKFKNIKNQAGLPFLSDSVFLSFKNGYQTDNDKFLIEVATKLKVLKGKDYVFDFGTFPKKDYPQCLTRQEQRKVFQAYVRHLEECDEARYRRLNLLRREEVLKPKVPLKEKEKESTKSPKLKKKGSKNTTPKSEEKEKETP